LRFFLDNNLSPHLARALNYLCIPDGIDVVHIREKFADHTPDIDWINGLAREGGWAIVTQDRLTKNPLEREALRTSGMVAFILAKQWSNHKHWDKSVQLVRWWPRIMQQADLVTSGAFHVPWGISGKGRLEPIRLK